MAIKIMKFKQSIPLKDIQKWLVSFHLDVTLETSFNSLKSECLIKL